MNAIHKCIIVGKRLVKNELSMAPKRFLSNLIYPIYSIGYEDAL